MAATTNLQKWIVTYTNQIQDLEQAFFQLINERTVDAAVGAQLDGVGSIVGEQRFGRNDPDYRVAIKGRIRLNKSNGTIEDIIAVLRSQIAKTVRITEDSFPAHFEAFFDETIDILGASVTSGNAEKFALVHLQTLTVAVDGGGAQLVTFDAADFVNIAEATADEVTDVLNLNLAGANVVHDSGLLTIRSDTLGDGGSIQVTGGTANAVLAFDTDLHTGEEANNALMVRVSNTMQQARLGGVRGILHWNTCETSFGFAGTTGALGFGAGCFASALDI